MAELSRERVLKASDDWQWVPPGAELLDIYGVPVIDYPDWARMGFYATPRLVSEVPDEVIDALCEAARTRGKSHVLVWVSPSTEPQAFADTLLARGARMADASEILALDLGHGVPDIAVDSRVECHIVGDAATLDDAERVSAVVWEGEPSSGERRAQQLSSLGNPLDAQGGFRVVAYLGGRPISTAGCQVVDGVARMYGAGTVPDAVRMGGYRATVAKRLEVAYSHGARMALAHARVGTSRPILAHVGFESYGECRLYTLSV